MAEANSEREQAENMQAMRKFEQRMKMVGTMQTMVENNKIIVSGETGEKLLGFFKDTTDLVNMAKIE